MMSEWGGDGGSGVEECVWGAGVIEYTWVGWLRV